MADKKVTHPPVTTTNNPTNAGVSSPARRRITVLKNANRIYMIFETVSAAMNRRYYGGEK